VAGAVAKLKRQPGNDHPAALELIGTKTTSRGVVAHIYLPSEKPEYGSAPPSKRTGWSRTR
jgi:hypothetical protein